MSQYNHTRSHSTSDLPTIPASAQLVTNLSTSQLQHLTYSIAPRDTPNRFSKFLEAPRNVPVPKRFTFDPQALAIARERCAQEQRTLGKNKDRSSKRVGGYRMSRRASVDLFKKEMKDIHDRLVEKVPHVEVPVLNVNWEWNWRFYTTGACLYAIELILAWDLTTLVLALPTISSFLDASSPQSFWIILASLLTASVVIPLFAHLSDIFGRKAMLLVALVFFSMGSFIAGISDSVAGLLLGRVVQGIGAGGMRALSGLVVDDLRSERDRGVWTGVLSVAHAIGIITGPVIGAALADHGAGRWIFWLNVPISGTVLIVLPWVANLKEATTGSVRSKLVNVDWIGWILLSGGLVGLASGLTWGGIIYPWTSGTVILSFLFGVIGLLAFCLWTWYSPIPALINMRPYATLASAATYLGVFLSGVISFAVAYFLPIVLLVANVSETLTGTSAYIVALTLSAGIFGLAASVLAHYQTRISVLHPATCLAWILVFIGTALLTQIARFSTFGILVGVLIVLGVGAGMLCGYLAASSTPALMSRSTQETRDEGRIPQIITSYAVFLSLGRTIGIAIGASIFQNSLYKQLLHNPATNGSAHSWTNDAVALIQVVRGMSVQQRSDMVPAYVAAVKPIWIFAAVLAGVGLLASSGAYWVGRERQRVEGERRIRTEAV